MSRRLSSALALAGTMALAFSQQAFAATVTAPVRVSGPSPYGLTYIRRSLGIGRPFRPRGTRVALDKRRMEEHPDRTRVKARRRDPPLAAATAKPPAAPRWWRRSSLLQ